ncbi:MAG: helix-turn-helix domain-containing protein [Sandaracinobacter sp.]
MSSSIPLVRASALCPAELWLIEQGFPAPTWLAEFGLPPSPSLVPDRPVSFQALLRFLGEMTTRVRPDFGSRISRPDLLLSLGVPATAIRASRNPREALGLIARSLHLHASHVFIRIEQAPGGLLVTEAIALHSSAIQFHAAHQHVAAIIVAMGCLATGEPLKTRIRLAPHPELGVAHLERFLGPDVAASSGRMLEIFIPDFELDQPFPWMPAPMPAGAERQLQPVGRDCLQSSLQELIVGMLEDCEPSLLRLAKTIGRSKRTLQRQLSREGTTFAEQVDSVRARRALGQLEQSGQKIAEIARFAGYRSSSSLTRAVRRWTDTTPRAFRRVQAMES